jgi:heme exporter protein C
MTTHSALASTRISVSVIAMSLALVMVAAAVVLILFVAPREATMGDVQRILYVHVAMAWSGLAGMIVVGLCGGIYLWRRNLAADHWAQAAAEVGWLCNLLTLVTGSLWARDAWGTWWTWDPRLTATLVLWVVYSSYLLLRAGVEDRHQRARLGAVVGLLGLLDIPLIVMATRWFRGMHPVAPEMDSTMRLVLLVSAISFFALFATLAVLRCSQLKLAAHLDFTGDKESWQPSSRHC